MLIFLASANRSGNSSPSDLTNISPAEDGNMTHLAGPAVTVNTRLASFIVTLFFLAAMIQLPTECETVTGMAPHCSRESCCALTGRIVNPMIEQETNRIWMLENDRNLRTTSVSREGKRSVGARCLWIPANIQLEKLLQELNSFVSLLKELSVPHTDLTHKHFGLYRGCAAGSYRWPCLAVANSG